MKSSTHAQSITDISLTCCPAHEFVYTALKQATLESEIDDTTKSIMVNVIDKFTSPPEPSIELFNGFCTCRFREQFDGFCPEVCRDAEGVSDC